MQLTKWQKCVNFIVLIEKIMNIFIKHLHISQKSSIFAVAFGLLGVFNVIPFYTTLYRVSAIVAQLVEQRIRNAWVAGLEAEN